MKHYIVYMECNMVGCEDVALLSMRDNHTEEELNDCVWDMVLDYGGSWQPDDMEWEEFEQGLSGHPELYDPKKHDGDRAGGGSWQDEIDRAEARLKTVKL